MSEKNIIWVRWQDPMEPLIPTEHLEEPPGLDEVSSRDSFSPAWKSPVTHHPMGNCLISPMGLIPVHESTLPSRLFHLWIGHCNFDLTKKIISQIESVAGVETLDVFTRYRLRLGIGLAFDENEVLSRVDAVVNARVSDPKSLFSILDNNYPFWAAVLNNGKVRFVSGTSEEEVERRLKSMNLDGEVCRSWEG